MKAGVCQTLREVAEAVAAGESHRLVFGNFLAFRDPERTAEACSEAPPPLRGVVPSGEVLDAYYAAAAEHLSRTAALKPPAWVEDPSRFLETW